MKLRFQPRDDVSQRVRTAAGLTVRLAGTTDALRFALAAGDDEAQRWLGWNRSQLVPIESQRHARRQTRGAASGPPLEDGSGATLLAALVGEDYVGGVQLSPVAGSDYSAVAGPDSRALGGVVVATLRGRGIGSAMFAAGALFAHERLGVARVVAACQVGHESSRRALLSAGFEPADGPGEHELPDGRVVPSLWFARSW